MGRNYITIYVGYEPRSFQKFEAYFLELHFQGHQRKPIFFFFSVLEIAHANFPNIFRTCTLIPLTFAGCIDNVFFSKCSTAKMKIITMKSSSSVSVGLQSFHLHSFYFNLSLEIKSLSFEMPSSIWG